jgi:hypothetical protein
MQPVALRERIAEEATAISRLYRAGNRARSR